MLFLCSVNLLSVEKELKLNYSDALTFQEIFHPSVNSQDDISQFSV